MKKSLLILLIVVTIASCKKKDTTTPIPTPVTSNPTTTTTLPDEYIILTEGSTTYTLSVTSGNYALSGISLSGVNPDTNNTYIFSACVPDNGTTNCNLSIDVILRLPSDSTKIQNFPIGKYATGKKDSTSTTNFDSNPNLVTNGTLGFNRDYSNDKYVSQKETSTATYYNTITSITRFKTEYSNLSNKLSEIFIVEGNFSVHCKSTSSNTTKDYTGVYKAKVRSWQF